MHNILKTHHGRLWLRGEVSGPPVRLPSSVWACPCERTAEEVYALICVCLWSGPFPSLLNARLWLGGINISAPGGKVITLIKWLTYYKRRLLEGKWRRDRVEKEAKQKDIKHQNSGIQFKGNKNTTSDSKVIKVNIQSGACGRKQEHSAHLELGAK